MEDILKLTVTLEHLERAQAKRGGTDYKTTSRDFMNVIDCVLAQASRDALGDEFSSCAAGEINLKCIDPDVRRGYIPQTPEDHRISQRIVNAFDNYDLDAAAKLLPATINWVRR